eukprot:scaffold18857_cov46-Phaeocystis_antarctica.AAC.1
MGRESGERQGEGRDLGPTPAAPLPPPRPVQAPLPCAWDPTPTWHPALCGSSVRQGVAHHDQVGVRGLLGDEHDLAGGAGQLDLVAGLAVAQEVGADALLGGVVGLELRAPVGGAADAERGGGAGHVVTVPRGGDRVQAHRVGLAVLRVGARRDDAGRLALPVRHHREGIDNNVARLARRLRADDALRRDDLTGVGRLVLVGVDRHARLVGVRRGLQEVLKAAGGRSRRREGRPVEGSGADQRDGQQTQSELALGTHCGVWTSRDQRWTSQ